MLEAILLASSLLFCGAKATYDDMDDEDFAAFVQAHDNFREKYAQAAAKGCVGGAIKDAYKGFPALCIGCATGAAAVVGVQMTFPKLPEKDK